MVFLLHKHIFDSSHLEALYDVHDKLLLMGPVENSAASRWVQQEDHISLATARNYDENKTTICFCCICCNFQAGSFSLGSQGIYLYENKTNEIITRYHKKSSDCPIGCGWLYPWRGPKYTFICVNGLLHYFWHISFRVSLGHDSV